MRNIVNGYADMFRHDRRVRIRFAALTLALAIIVAGAVFWQLHDTGIAMANETYCGLEEHSHDESCYARVLACGIEETPDEHGHDESCYRALRTLVCGLEESGNVFDEEGSLIAEGHAHSDDCYVTERVLACEEAVGHIHDGSCYEKVLVCGIPEHVHDINCMVDETADVETAKDWEATLPEELTGVWADDVAATALSQIGYTESERNFRLAEDGETRQGYTRYGEWYGNPYGDWDAMFVSFCLHYAGVDEEVFPQASGAYSWTAELGKLGLYALSGNCVPVPGYVVFLDMDQDGRADHAGIVSGSVCENDGGEAEILVIEGDCGGAVRENAYPSDSDLIIGYGVIPEEPSQDGENFTGDESTENPELSEIPDGMISEDTVYEAESGDVKVTVKAPAGTLPENAELYAVLYDRDSGEYRAAKEAAGAVSGEWSGGSLVWTGDEDNLLALNIGFTSDGEDVEPSGNVEVIIDVSGALPEDADKSTLEVFHLEETDNGMEAVAVAGTGGGHGGTVDGENATAFFSVGSLSPFTVVWTAATGRTATITVNVLDMENGDEAIGTASGNYTFVTESSGSFVRTYTTTLDVETLASEITLGTGYDDYYTLCYASAVYSGGGTYGDENNSLTSIEIQKTSSTTGSTVYTFHYGSSSATETHTRSGSSSSVVTLNLYYRHVEASVSISASVIAGEGHVSGYALSETTLHFDYTEDMEISWSVEPEGIAVLSAGSDGTAELIWLDEDQDLSGKGVTVTVIVKGTNKHGEEVEVSDSINLYYDAAQVETVEIEDDIKYNGDLLAVVRDDSGNEILDHSGLLFVWYVSDSSGSETDDSRSMVESLLSSTTYSRITNQDLFDEKDDEEPDDDRALNVARERGGLRAFYVEVYDKTDTGLENCLAVSGEFYVPYAMKLLNGSFEYPNTGSSMLQTEYDSVPYWGTTADDRLIEIVPYSNSDGWGTQYGNRTIYAGGSQAASGNQYAELNAESYGALYQDVLTAPGSELTWSVSHRARTSGWSQNFSADNAMYVVTMSTNDAEMLLDGVSQANQQDVVLSMLKSAGSVDAEGVRNVKYALQSGTYAGEAEVTFSAWYETVHTELGGEWNDNVSGTYNVPENQYLTRFFFVAEHGYSPIDENDPTVGNLLDMAEFSQSIEWHIDIYVYDSETDTYVLREGLSYGGVDDVFGYVYAEYDKNTYHLAGSVTGSATGGENPSFDRITRDYMMLDQNSNYLSLYLMENGAVVRKTLEGFSGEELDEIYSGGGGNAVFTLSEESGDTLEFTVEVGNEGTGLHILSPLNNGSYTLTETEYAGTLLGGSYIWQKAEAYLNGGERELRENQDGSCSLDFTLSEYAEIEFVNYYVPLLTIEKTDSADPDRKLGGAGFILSVTVDEDDGKITYYYTAGGWVTERSGAETLVTGSDGLTFAGLWDNAPGAVYTLEETEAPEGYDVFEGAVTFTVSDGEIILTGGPDSVSAEGMTLTVRDSESLRTVTVYKYAEITGEGGGETSYEPLRGAEFILSKTSVNDNGEPETVYYAESEISVYPDGDGGGINVVNPYWTEDISGAKTLISGEDGYIHVSLAPGEYTLTEIRAPEGYLMPEGGFAFTVDAEGNITADNIYAGVSVSGDGILMIRNLPGSELPRTGGYGALLYIFAGTLLSCGAALLLLVRRRGGKRA